jgi:hypothetical protein
MKCRHVGCTDPAWTRGVIRAARGRTITHPSRPRRRAWRRSTLCHEGTTYSCMRDAGHDGAHVYWGPEALEVWR